MRRRRGAALVAVVGACVALVSGAGAATHPGVRAGAAKFDFSTRTGVVRYLASVGLHSRGFVIQRGHRNYAGPSCPGKGWTCTRSTRVVQVGTVNRAVLSVEAAAAPAPACPTVVQNGSSNSAKLSVTTGSSQSCTVTQTASGSGSNDVQLTETISQTSVPSQTASQDAQVTQTSVTGSNSSKILQTITQSISQPSTSPVNESQESDQTYSVKQNVTQSTPTAGINSSRADQSLTQTETATSATSGSQYQRANLTGHVDQFSHALSTSQNNQTESQTETAVLDSSVSQTQIGPTRCCTSQGDNTRDTFKVVQKTTQKNNSANRSFTEDAQIDLSTTGSANGSQTITQNNQTTTNSSTGSTVNLGTTCTQGTCTPTQTGFPSGNVFVSIGDGKVNEYQPDGTFVATLNTLHAGSFTTGSAFDAAGNLYVTDFGADDVSKFDTTGQLVGSFGTGYNLPESIVFDSSGNAYVGQASGALLRFTASGSAAGSFSPAPENVGVDWIDLAPDQCTVYYTSEGTSVKTFNVCTNPPFGVQGADFATDLPGTNAFALQLVPGGGALVADRQSIVRLNASGGVAQSYDAAGEDCWFGLALDPDATSFWSTDFCTGDVARFSITTGALLTKFNTGTGPDTVFGVSVAP
jgi:hypothetical protein